MQDDFSTAEPLPQAEPNSPLEPDMLTKRIGKMTYQVIVHFSAKSKETMDEKIKRLMEQESQVNEVLEPTADRKSTAPCRKQK